MFAGPRDCLVTSRPSHRALPPKRVRVAFWAFVSLEWALVAGVVAAPAVAWFTILRTPPDAPGIAGRVTVRSIRGIRMGDTKASVLSALGPPTAEHSKTASEGSTEGSYYFYRRRGPLSATLDEGRLWVHFDPRGRVAQVYAKSGDDGVYGLGSPMAPKAWEHTPAFEETFPRPKTGT